MKPLIAWFSNREVDMLKIFQVAAREIKLAMLPTSWDGLQHMPRKLSADLPDAFHYCGSLSLNWRGHF
jgi:hypothetical protein